jgi:hypothetical protein
MPVGVKYIMGNWMKIMFWHEVWFGKCPLRIKYEKLYNICKQQSWEVAIVLRGGDINLTF